MEHTVYVNVVLDTDDEEELEVEIDIDAFTECEDSEEKIEYIKEETKKQHDNVKSVNFNKSDIKEVEKEIDDILDPSDMIPNEDYDEFMDHEDF